MNLIQIETDKRKLAWGIIVTILLVFFFTFAPSLIRHLAGEEISYPILFWISRFGFWICLLLVLVYALRIEKNPLLIWKERPLSVPEGIATAFGLFGAVMIGLSILSMTILLTGYKEDHSSLKKMLELFGNNHFLLFFTVITAGVVEELIFRGYLLPRMTILFRNSFLAMLISSLLFGFLHFGYGNFSQIAGPFWMGLVFAAYYREYRNIKALIIFHAVWDVFSILIGMYVKR